MNAIKGYYSLVQYCPDMARQEAANVGVVLFCPDQRFLRAKVTDTIRRIRRFFGEDVDGHRHLHGMMEAVVNRLELEQTEFKTLSDFQQFVDTRANKIILTRPKPILVKEPEEDLRGVLWGDAHVYVMAALSIEPVVGLDV